jgi:hypothetical protein
MGNPAVLILSNFHHQNIQDFMNMAS